jgi:hypothetical protein
MKTTVLLFRNELGWHISPFKKYISTKVFGSLREAKNWIDDNNYIAFRAYNLEDI